MHENRATRVCLDNAPEYFQRFIAADEKNKKLPYSLDGSFHNIVSRKNGSEAGVTSPNNPPSSILSHRFDPQVGNCANSSSTGHYVYLSLCVSAGFLRTFRNRFELLFNGPGRLDYD